MQIEAAKSPRRKTSESLKNDHDEKSTTSFGPIVEAANISTSETANPTSDIEPCETLPGGKPAGTVSSSCFNVVLFAILLVSFGIGLCSGGISFSDVWKESSERDIYRADLFRIRQFGQTFYSYSWNNNVGGCANILLDIKTFITQVELPVQLILEEAELLEENEIFLEAIIFHYAAALTIFKKKPCDLTKFIRNSTSIEKTLMFDSMFLAKDIIRKIVKTAERDNQSYMLCSRVLWESYIHLVIHNHVFGKYYQHQIIKQMWLNISRAISYEDFGQYEDALSIGVDTMTAATTILGSRFYHMETSFWSHHLFNMLSGGYSSTNITDMSLHQTIDVEASTGLQEIIFRFFPYSM